MQRSQFPKYIYYHIGTFCNFETARNLALTCKSCYDLFKTVLKCGEIISMYAKYYDQEIDKVMSLKLSLKMVPDPTFAILKFIKFYGVQNIVKSPKILRGTVTYMASIGAYHEQLYKTFNNDELIGIICCETNQINVLKKMEIPNCDNTVLVAAINDNLEALKIVISENFLSHDIAASAFSFALKNNSLKVVNYLKSKFANLEPNIIHLNFGIFVTSFLGIFGQKRVDKHFHINI